MKLDHTLAEFGTYSSTQHTAKQTRTLGRCLAVYRRRSKWQSSQCPTESKASIQLLYADDS